MNKKTKPESFGALVYSTNRELNNAPGEEEQPMLPASQDLRVWLEKNHRGGKTATVIRGYTGRTSDLEALGKQIKQTCGTGGTVKDGEIIIQGDHRDKVVALLSKLGYTSKKAGG